MATKLETAQKYMGDSKWSAPEWDFSDGPPKNLPSKKLEVERAPFDPFINGGVDTNVQDSNYPKAYQNPSRKI